MKVKNHTMRFDHLQCTTWLVMQLVIPDCFTIFNCSEIYKHCNCRFFFVVVVIAFIHFFLFRESTYANQLVLISKLVVNC